MADINMQPYVLKAVSEFSGLHDETFETEQQGGGLVVTQSTFGLDVSDNLDATRYVRPDGQFTQRGMSVLAKLFIGSLASLVVVAKKEGYVHPVLTPAGMIDELMRLVEHFKKDPDSGQTRPGTFKL
jgi:hypothetical protein